MNLDTDFGTDLSDHPTTAGSAPEETPGTLGSKHGQTTGCGENRLQNRA
ncbi:hypothetical protein [Rubrobacter indicoceani]|nr:hypothetical protein [Rubrobacter indicoceani]